MPYDEQSVTWEGPLSVGSGPKHQAGKRTLLDGPEADALHVGAG